MKKPKRLFRRRDSHTPDPGAQIACPDQHQWVSCTDLGPDYDDRGHYWDYQCRLCPAIGVECQWCFGTRFGHDGVYSTNPDHLNQTLPREVCPRCAGNGIIEIVEITLAEIQRLRAKAGEP
jgi:hypothetical protein